MASFRSFGKRLVYASRPRATSATDFGQAQRLSVSKVVLVRSDELSWLLIIDDVAKAPSFLPTCCEAIVMSIRA